MRFAVLLGLVLIAKAIRGVGFDGRELVVVGLMLVVVLCLDTYELICKVRGGRG